MLLKLQENVFPSIVSSLKETGNQYVHIAIDVRYSRCFFSHQNIAFPFNERDMYTAKNDKGENVSFVIFNLNSDGQLSISENRFVAQNGLNALGNTVILFEDFNEMFKAPLRLENALIFIMSREFTNQAKHLREEISILRALLDDMEKIQPRITRKVFTEKNKNSK